MASGSPKVKQASTRPPHQVHPGENLGTGQDRRVGNAQMGRGVTRQLSRARGPPC